MSLLSKVTSGIEKKPPFLLIYGTPKVGKTTFASKAPSPLIIDIEQGSHRIDTKRLMPENYAEVVQILKDLATTKHDYKTVIIDSLDHLEPWVWAMVCKREGKSSIEDVGGGYSKGYMEALREWGEIISLLKKCRDEKGMMIICIAHVHIKTMNDPTQIASYDKFELKFHAKASALFKENADAILFARQEILIAGGGEKKKGKAVGEGKRVLYTQGMPGYEAGNRFNLPNEMELDFEEVYRLIQQEEKPVDPEQLIKQIKGLAAVVNKEVSVKALAATDKAGNDIKELQKIYKKLLEIGGK